MKKRLDWVEHVLSGFTSDRELIQLVLGDLSEEWHNLAARRGRIAASAWYIYQLKRTALHLAGQWCYSASRGALLTKLAIVVAVSCLAVIVTTLRYHYSLSFTNFLIGMFSAGAEGGDPLIIHWNDIARKTQFTGVVCAFVGAFILGAGSRIAPMVSVMLLSLVLVIATLLIPLASQAVQPATVQIIVGPLDAVWPLWSFVTMPLAILLATTVGGITGLLAKTVMRPNVSRT